MRFLEGKTLASLKATIEIKWTETISLGFFILFSTKFPFSIFRKKSYLEQVVEAREQEAAEEAAKLAKKLDDPNSTDDQKQLRDGEPSDSANDADDDDTEVEDNTEKNKGKDGEAKSLEPEECSDFIDSVFKPVFSIS